MAPRARAFVLLCVGIALSCTANALDQTDLSGLSPEDQLTAYKARAGEHTKQIQELEAAKALLQKQYNSNEVAVQTLQNVISQQQKRVSALELDLHNKDSEHGSLRTKLEQLQSTLTGASSGAQEDAVKAEAQLTELQGRLKIAEQEKAAAEKAQKNAEKTAASLGLELQRAAEHSEKLADRARTAEAGHKTATDKLKSAGLEASSARKLVEAAEKKASDATAQAQELLLKLQSSWTPHWLDQRLSSSRKWVDTNVLSSSGKQNAAGYYFTLIETKLNAFYQQVKAFVLHTNKNLGPHLTTAQKHSKTAWLASKKHSWNAWVASKKHTNTFLASPTVKNAQKQVSRYQRSLESALRAQMKKVPALQPYAKKPYTSYIVYFLVALPLTVVVLPILGAVAGFLTGSSRRKARKSASARQTPARSAKANTAASATPSRTSRPNRRTSQRIAEGSDVINVP